MSKVQFSPLTSIEKEEDDAEEARDGVASGKDR